MAASAGCLIVSSGLVLFIEFLLDLRSLPTFEQSLCIILLHVARIVDETGIVVKAKIPR